MQWTRYLASAALGAAFGCGRVGFEPWTRPQSDTSTVACTADFLVDTAADDPGQALTCDGAGCSLRAAVARVNAGAGSTICIADGLSIAVATQLVVTRDVTITGPSAICGTGSDRVFHVAPGGALRLRDLTVCHGRLTDAQGAGVLVASGATLDVDRVVFDDHAVISDTAEQEGGVIRADGDAVVEIRNARFTNNHITVSAAATAFARGGAIAIQAGSAARVVIEDTAFEDNTSTDVGGAMYLAIDAANLTLARLLFARNSSDTGAAIDINCASTGTFVIDSSTFASNMAPNGVIYVCTAQTVRLSFCSADGNTTSLVQFGAATGRAEWHANAIHAGAFDLCAGLGTGASLDYNVADRAGAVCPLGGTNGSHDRLVDPMLGPLADHGGPTATLALSPGSPAIDAGGAMCPPIDQRGVARPAGAACDAGAFEAE
jgi:hypothetical protein